MPRHARRLADDAGQGLIEYALILGLTSLGIALALLVLRNSIVNPVQGFQRSHRGRGPGAARPPPWGDGRRGAGRRGEPARRRRARTWQRPGQQRQRERQRRAEWRQQWTQRWRQQRERQRQRGTAVRRLPGPGPRPESPPPLRPAPGGRRRARDRLRRRVAAHSRRGRALVPRRRPPRRGRPGALPRRARDQPAPHRLAPFAVRARGPSPRLVHGGDGRPDDGERRRHGADARAPLGLPRPAGRSAHPAHRLVRPAGASGHRPDAAVARPDPRERRDGLARGHRGGDRLRARSPTCCWRSLW